MDVITITEDVFADLIQKAHAWGFHGGSEHLDDEAYARAIDGPEFEAARRADLERLTLNVRAISAYGRNL